MLDSDLFIRQSDINHKMLCNRKGGVDLRYRLLQGEGSIKKVLILRYVIFEQPPTTRSCCAFGLEEVDNNVRNIKFNKLAYSEFLYIFTNGRK